MKGKKQTPSQSTKKPTPPTAPASRPDETATNPDYHQMMTETIPMKDAVALLYHPLYDFIPEEERAAFISFFLRNHEELAASYIKQGDDAFQSLQELRTKIKVIHFVKKQHPKAPSKLLPQLVKLEKARRECQRQQSLTKRDYLTTEVTLEKLEAELDAIRGVFEKWNGDGKDEVWKNFEAAVSRRDTAARRVEFLRKKLTDYSKKEKEVAVMYRRAVARMQARVKDAKEKAK
ncbi:hypothetical protein HDU67_010440 [Dinochytrium kinnereticum]|nr:hypothetical protein HDU67_010440 [Dinochytrium kinnereticum]